MVTAGIGPVDALGLEGDGSILVLDRNGLGLNPVARFDANGNPQSVALAGTLAPISSLYNATFQGDGKSCSEARPGGCASAASGCR